MTAVGTFRSHSWPRVPPFIAAVRQRLIVCGGLKWEIVVMILVRLPGQIGSPRRLKWVWFGCRRGIAMTSGSFSSFEYGENTISGLSRRGHRRCRVAGAVAIVTTMVLWMKTAAAGLFR